MKMPKINWAAVGSIVCLLGGFIFDEMQRASDNEETKNELKNYVDQKFAEASRNAND